MASLGAWGPVAADLLVYSLPEAPASHGGELPRHGQDHQLARPEHADLHDAGLPAHACTWQMLTERPVLVGMGRHTWQDLMGKCLPGPGGATFMLYMINDIGAS